MWKMTLALAWVSKRLFAFWLRLTVTVALAPPRFNVPPVDETVSQLEVLARLQVKGFEPVFARV